MWIPTWLMLVALCGSPACLVIGLAAGAFLYHRGYTGKSPVPSIEDMVRAIKPKKEPDEKPKPAQMPMMRV